jgi:hypothetical protein
VVVQQVNHTEHLSSSSGSEAGQPESALDAVFPSGNTVAHTDDDHPATLLGAASRNGHTTSSGGISVRRSTDGTYGVDCADGLTARQAHAAIEDLDQAGLLRASR